MKLRISTGRVSPRFNEREMFYNQHIVIARNYLIVKKDNNHSYLILGYLGNSVLVQNESGCGCLQIFYDGTKGCHFNKLPQGATRLMDAGCLGLKRVEKGLNP